MPIDPPALVKQTVDAVRKATGNPTTPLLLHQPKFAGNEWSYIKQCIDTAWVSSAGNFVTQFEQNLAQFTGSAHAVAVMNGTAALHIALLLSGVNSQDEVLIPSLTFVATANAVSHCGAVPHLCEVNGVTLGLDPAKLADHLDAIASRRDGACFNKQTGRKIAAVVPMHTFGHCVDMTPLIELAARWNLPIIEDAAEAIGSYYHGRHAGTLARIGVLSFNGNKIITTGAGGAILTNDQALASRAKHLTTTAKQPHVWELIHDEVGYNYRMPNICAALGCAQLEQLPRLLESKRELAAKYKAAFAKVQGVGIVAEPPGSRSNYWLNAIALESPDLPLRDQCLQALIDAGLQSRPAWRPMHQLPMYQNCPRMDLSFTETLAAQLICLPSSAQLGDAR